MSVIKKISVFLLSLFVAVGSFVSPRIVKADNSFSLDNTSIEDDLSGYDLSSFVVDDLLSVSVLDLQEFCFSLKSSYDSSFALYVYIYNPTGKEVVTSSGANVLNMAIHYDSSGKPDNYSNVPLVFLDKTDNDLLYKFRIDFNFLNIERAVYKKSFMRRYDIAGVQLLFAGNDLGKDFKVAWIYYYSGFAVGCSEDDSSVSSLSCKREKLETVEFDVKHTFWRSQSSSLGNYHQNQLDTVYFSVPDRYFEEYGNLQRIKAEWYEYKTTPIVVTSNKNFYNSIPIGEVVNSDFPFLLWGHYGRSAGGNYFDYTDYGWNTRNGLNNLSHRYVCNERSYDVLYYKFLCDDLTAYDPYSSLSSVGVHGNDLYDYIFSTSSERFDFYYREMENGAGSDMLYSFTRFPPTQERFWRNMFEDDIDSSRKMNNSRGVVQKGFSYYDFDVFEDTQEMRSWADTNPSFWDSWKSYGFWRAITNSISDDHAELSPLYVLNSNDFVGDDKSCADNLYVNYNHYDDIKDFYTESKRNLKKTVLFRFAVSDYYSAPAEIHMDGWWNVKNNEAYVAQETVFLNFEILSLTFKKNDVLTVIPAVSNPINIVDDITAPVGLGNDSSDNWFKWLLGLLFLVLLFIVLAPFLPYIIKVVVWIIKSPFKLAGSIKKLRSDKRRGERKNE
ncbi:MAG: hypothetical protein IJ706_06595 [Clostridia bacterium]|nr:hypothetical protein [Clostridia bacterium]